MSLSAFRRELEVVEIDGERYTLTPMRETSIERILNTDYAYLQLFNNAGAGLYLIHTAYENDRANYTCFNKEDFIRLFMSPLKLSRYLDAWYTEFRQRYPSSNWRLCHILHEFALVGEHPTFTPINNEHLVAMEKELGSFNLYFAFKQLDDAVLEVEL